MKVTIERTFRYMGQKKAELEDCDLTVEGSVFDNPESVANVYLKLRKQLDKGIKKEVK